MRLDLGQAAHLYLIGGKGLLAMLAAYLDCAGHSRQAGRMMLSGFVAPVEKWTQFEEWWRSLLLEPTYAIPYVHAKEIYDNWRPDRRGMLYAHANDLLRRTALFGISTSIELADYKSIFRNNRPSTKDSPYGFCFRGLMVWTCSHISANYRGETISYVLEKGDPGQGGALRAAESTKIGAEMVDVFREAYPIGTVTTATKGQFGALDTADMYAFSDCKQASDYQTLVANIPTMDLRLTKHDLALYKKHLLGEKRLTFKEKVDETKAYAIELMEKRSKQPS